MAVRQMHLGQRTEEVLDAATEVLHGRIDEHRREHGPHLHGYTFVEVTDAEAAGPGVRRARPGVPMDPPVDLPRTRAGPIPAGPPTKEAPPLLPPNPTWPQLEAALEHARQAEKDAAARREKVWRAFDDFAAAAPQPLDAAVARWERMIENRRQKESEIAEWWAEVEEERRQFALEEEERRAREQERCRMVAEARRAAEEDERRLREARRRWQDSLRRAEEAEFGEGPSRAQKEVEKPPHTGAPRHCAVCNYPGVRKPRFCPNKAEHPRDRMP